MKKPTFKHLFLVMIVVLTAFAAPAFASVAEDYKAAVELAEEQDPQAETLLEAIDAQGQALGDLASYRLILRDQKAGSVDDVLERSRKHLDRYESSRTTPLIELTRVDYLLRAGKPDEAKKMLDAFDARYPGHARNVEKLTLLGRYYEAKGQWKKAQQAYGQAIYLYPYTGSTREASDRVGLLQQKKLHYRVDPDASLYKERIEYAIANRNYYTCKRLCDSYAQQHPGGDSWKMMLRGVDCLMERRKRSEARSYLKAIEDRIPDTDEGRAAIEARWARAEAGRDFKGRPRTSFHEIAEKYPKTEGGKFAHYWIGYIEYDNYRFASAGPHLELFLQSAAFPEYRARAYWYAGFSRYLNKDYLKAIDHFSAFIKEFPDDRDLDRAHYWRARALEGVKNINDAKNDYQWLVKYMPGTYYGLAAQVQLEKLGEPSFVVQERLLETVPWEHVFPFGFVAALRPEWSQQYGGGQSYDDGAQCSLKDGCSIAHPLLVQPIRNFLALYEAGMEDEALKEANFLYEERLHVPEAGFMAGVMYSLLGYNLKSILAANATADTVRKGELFDPYRLNARRQFPLLYFDLLSKYAKEHEVDPWLVISLVKQESAFLNKAKSWAGAQGLMQIMPGTGKWIARKRGITDFKVKDLYDHETSADFGVWFLARLLTNNDHDVPKALAGYNAGGLRADRWWGANPGRHYDAMLELVGFDETRAYVKTIMRNWEMYQRLYRDPYDPLLDRETVFTLLLKTVPEPLIGEE